MTRPDTLSGLEMVAVIIGVILIRINLYTIGQMMVIVVFILIQTTSSHTIIMTMVNSSSVDIQVATVLMDHVNSFTLSTECSVHRGLN